MVRPRIDDELWQDLNEKKQSPDDSIEDVIRRLLKQAVNEEQLNSETDEKDDDRDTPKRVTDGGQIEVTHVDLPSNVRQKIRDRRQGLRTLAADNGPFSQHAARLLDFVEDQTEVSARS